MNLSDEEEEDYNLSLSKFESMLKTNKILFFDSEEFEEIVLHYLDTGKATLAKKALKLALEQHPNSTGLKLVQVEIYIYDEKLDRAEKLLNELENIESQNEEIYIQRSIIFSKKNQHEKAVECLKTALEYSDDVADVLNLLGMEYLFMDKLQEAKEVFIRCIDENPDDHTALYNIVYCFEFLDQEAEAIVYLNEYIDENPYSEIAWHQVGRLNYGLNNFEEALKAFDYATLIDDEFLGAFMEKAKTLERLKKYEDAIVAYKRTIELDDPTSYAYLRIGKCYERLGNKELALEFYNKTIHEDPLLDKGWNAIADFYLRDEHYEKALLFLNKALNIDGENFEYWKRYAFINRKMKQYDEAFLGFEKTIEFSEPDVNNWTIWADTLQLIGEFENAVTILLQSTEFFPESSEIEYRLAGLYFMLGKDKQGKFHISNAIRLDGKNYQMLKDLFPVAWKRRMVQNIIKKYLDSGEI